MGVSWKQVLHNIVPILSDFILMTPPFKFAHATHPDWADAAQACMTQMGAIPESATLGFL
jgi:hypothetical protein